MKVHAESSNMKAAAAIGRKAQAALQLYGNELTGFNKLESILTEIDRTLTDIDTASKE